MSNTEDSNVYFIGGEKKPTSFQYAPSETPFSDVKAAYTLALRSKSAVRADVAELLLSSRSNEEVLGIIQALTVQHTMSSPEAFNAAVGN